MFNIIAEEITIEKKEYINSFLKQNPTENSELTFTNLFMWRKSYNVRYKEIKGMLVIISKHKDSLPVVYFPIGDGDLRAVIDEIDNYFKNSGEKYAIRADEKNINILKEMYPDKFDIKEDINSNDYVYKVSDLVSLKGKKYHAKRNFINRFSNTYNYSYERIGPEDKEECMILFKKWFEEKKDIVSSVEEELEAVRQLLDNWEKLDIIGGCIRVDGKMIAFSFGEPFLCENNMAVIHLEHADVSYDGAFPMMNRTFLEKEWSDFEFVNREEDMGLEGLRKAKQSYYPYKMTRKYLAYLR